MDEDVIAQIDKLVEEEHRLHGQSAQGRPLTKEEQHRLQEIEVRLDQCWDLLRQRRARVNAGRNPDEAEVRPPEIVERYQQ